jgi:NAD(P)-dependent dehydrogenase (short-subunit alcohol dehydrogenase family)
MPSAETNRVAVATGASQGIGRAIARRLADDGYDVAVSDIPAAFDALAARVAEIERQGRRAIDVIFNMLASTIALGRAQQPENVADLVPFFASTKSDYMTGQTVIMDGGMIFS